MILKDFYTENTRKKIEKDTFLFKISLNFKHPVYKGHFPKQPVVPGVLLLELLKELISNITEKKLSLSKVVNVKYLNMITPENKELIIEIKTQNKETQIQAKATIKTDNLIFTKASCHYKIVT